MLDKNRAMLWILENPNTRTFVAFIVTEDAYAVSNDGHTEAVSKAKWLSQALADNPEWREHITNLTRFWEMEGYQLVMADTIPVGISHHRDLEAARHGHINSPALAFTVSSNLNRLQRAGLRPGALRPAIWPVA